MKPLNKLLTIFFATGCILTASSCHKNIDGVTAPDKYAGTTMSEVFEAYWAGMNNYYVFWDIDTTNWDRVYNTYKGVFAGLDINSKTDVQRACGYFREMSKGLTDCHYNISFSNRFLTDSFISPSFSRKKISPPLSDAFFSTTITRKYFDTGYLSVDSFYKETFAGKTSTVHMRVVTGTIKQHISYLRINRFALKYVIDQGYYSVDKAWKKFLANMRDAGNKSSWGIIIDLRSNVGGYLDDMDFIVGQMTANKFVFAHTREKSGNGRLDYTPWAEAVVIPQAGATQVSQPIVVLTDQNSISMAEMTAMALKTFPNTTIIGDTTWGANGPLSTSIDLFGGGQFSFANFGYVYTSSAEYKYIDGKNYENNGFPPDKYVPYDRAKILSGSDPQLEAAITLLNH